MVAAVVHWVMLICQDCSCQVQCAGAVWGERGLQAAQAAHRGDCEWQTLFRSLLPGSQHIPLSLPAATEGLVLLVARDWDLQYGIQHFLL